MRYWHLLLIIFIIGIAWYVFSRPHTDISISITSGTIVAFGDSLTYGPEVDAAQNYPSQLQQLLRDRGYDFTVINEGVNGDTTADGLARVDAVLAHNPDIVLLVLGGNDFLRIMSPTDAQRNLAQIMERIQKTDAVIILGGMRAVGPQVSTEYKEQFNQMYSELADQYDVLLIPDFLDGVRLRSKYNLPDRIHPNALGYGVIVRENIWPVFKTLL